MSQFYIMKAHHLTTSGRKLGLKKILRDEPNGTILVATREYGYNKKVPCFILGCRSEDDYNVGPDTKTTYTVDTGMGYKNRNEPLTIEHTLRTKDGAITHCDGQAVKPGSPPPDVENRYTWVMK